MCVYPLLVLIVIVGTGNHYLLDAIVGTVCVGLGVLAGRLIHGRAVRVLGLPAPTAQVIRAAAFYGFAAFLLNGLIIGEFRL